MRRTTITLTDDVAEMVEQEAQRRRTSVSAVIQDYVTTGLTGGSQEPREIPWAGLFHDPDMPPAAQLDEVLKAQWADDLDRDRG